MNKILALLLTIAVACTAYVLMTGKKDTINPKVETKALIKKKGHSNLIETKIPFEKKILAGSKISILTPKSWHTFQERTTNGLIYYITPYKYEDLAKFKRGLAVTIIKNVSKTEGQSPDDYALTCIENAQTINPTLKLTKVNVQHLKGYLFRLEEKKGTKNSLVTSFLFVADNKFDIFYSFIFQYERDKWKDTFPIRNTIFKNIKFIQ